jgi:predicted metal-dependent hydrolase
MSTSSAALRVSGIPIDVVYKDIKNLHIGVYPPAGRVRVAAPISFDDDKVRLAVVRRLTWIKRQRERLRAADRQTEREMMTGESHYVWGLRHRLKVIERAGRSHVEVDGNRLLLYVPVGTVAERRRDVLGQWHRQQLKLAIPPLIAKWEGIMGVSVPLWSVRRMKTKWGSCNRQTRHIWFNVELVKKHPDCLEYIVVHEMAHYVERNHGDRFTQLMDGFMPDWRARRDQLNAAHLRHEEWSC